MKKGALVLCAMMIALACVSSARAVNARREAQQIPQLVDAKKNGANAKKSAEKPKKKPKKKEKKGKEDKDEHKSPENAEDEGAQAGGKSIQRPHIHVLGHHAEAAVEEGGDRPCSYKQDLGETINPKEELDRARDECKQRINGMARLKKERTAAHAECVRRVNRRAIILDDSAKSAGTSQLAQCGPKIAFAFKVPGTCLYARHLESGLKNAMAAWNKREHRIHLFMQCFEEVHAQCVKRGWPRGEMEAEMKKWCAGDSFVEREGESFFQARWGDTDD